MMVPLMSLILPYKFGVHALPEFITTYPLLSAAFALVVITPGIALKIKTVWQRRQVIHRESQIEARRIATAREELDKYANDLNFYDYLGGYLHAAQPHDKSPARQEIDDIITGARLAETAFKSQGLDWTMAHWISSEYTTVADVAKRLRLFDMINPIQMAQEQSGEPLQEALMGCDYESTEYLEFLAKLDDIQAEFNILGGIERFQKAANKALHQKLKGLHIPSRPLAA